MANKYANGKIYAIMSPQTDKMYIGSTVQPLHTRFSEHKRHKRYSSEEILQYSDSYIKLLEDFPCNSMKELHRREGFYIMNNNCVNKRIAGRTDKEMREINKEKTIEYHKQYYETYKQKKIEYEKQYREINKEKISIRKAEYYQKKKQLNNNSLVLVSANPQVALQP
jgi:hypothetical protein